MAPAAEQIRIERVEDCPGGPEGIRVGRPASNSSIVASNDAAAGPGHCYVVVTPSGATWLLYHAWPPDAIGSTISWGRQLWMEPVTWRGDVPSVHPSQADPAAGAALTPVRHGVRACSVAVRAHRSERRICGRL